MEICSYQEKGTREASRITTAVECNVVDPDPVGSEIVFMSRTVYKTSTDPDPDPNPDPD